jgi:hypothetical protein
MLTLIPNFTPNPATLKSTAILIDKTLNYNNTMKLKPIEPRYRNKFVIEIVFMHGDGDSYSTEECPCDDGAEFTKIMKGLENVPQDPGSGGDDAYKDFFTDLIGEDFVPGDVTRDHQFLAAYDGHSGFFYDQAGNKFEAEI